MTPPNPHEREIPQEIADKILQGLTALEAKVVRLRFGIGGGSPMTVEKIARSTGMNRERIRQIEFKAIKKLGKRLQKKN